MSSDPKYKYIRVLESDKYSGEKYKNKYIVEVIKNTDEILIGIPVQDAIDRVRVEKIKGRVLFYRSENEDVDQKIREGTLQKIGNKADWLDDYFS